MTAFDELMAYQRETCALQAVAARTGWDQETMMPKGAAAQRGEEMAALEAVLHARKTDPRVGDWLEAAEPEDDTGRAHLREIRRSFERTRRVPAELATEIARATSLAQGIWAQARADEDVAAFLPVLRQVVDLRRQEAAALAAGGDPYDALLEDYEPGISGAEIATLFDRMRPRLAALRDRVLGAGDAPKVSGSFAEPAQLELSELLSRSFGYSFETGRIDLAVHPFSSGSGRDVRITTRVAEDDPFNCIYSTIHEVGHATYEQNVTPDYLLTALGQGASMGVHESQSRIYENQLGRSAAFTGWLFGQMRDRFGDLGVRDARAFYRAVNRVQQGFIRTEADEVQYNLHIMLRFDLERRLMAGDLVVDDLEAAWNDRFLADFGVAVDRPSNGVLQDVHWSVGLFGYFPTYSLGNVYAGCLFDALQRDVPDWRDGLEQGDASACVGWLRDRLQRHGSRYPPRETIELATGQPVSEAPLLDYLDAKFSDLYGL